MVDRQALELEAKRIYMRYACEVIEALGFCPWARAAREAGRVAVHVVFGERPELSDALRAVLAADADAGSDITLLVFPECELLRVPFQHFAAELRAQYDTARGRGETALAIADFHPDAAADLASPERLVPFVRRSPDPTLQLVRHSALAQAKSGAGPSDSKRYLDLDDAAAIAAVVSAHAAAPNEPAHERVARANLRTVSRMGVRAVSAQLEDITQDRHTSYARLGLQRPPWARRSTAQ